MKKKKVLFIHPALVFVGTERVLINYLNLLSQKGKYEIELILIKNKENYDFDKINQEVKVKYILSDIESEFFILSYIEKQSEYFNSWFNGIKERINSRILDIINQGGYDVIIDFHKHLANFEEFINHYDINKSIPVLYWIHGKYIINLWENNPSYYSYVLAKYTHFIAINESMNKSCSHALNNLGIKNSSVITLYNPINIENIRLQANILLIPEYYKKLINEPFILQVARLDPIKNHLEMIEIFYQLKQKGVKEKLYLIGEGEARNELEDKIKELELENDCLLLGKIENPFPFMQQAKLFIHTSKIEGLPTVLIESMACGTPVVAYDCPFGPKEILADGKYGELIPLHDKERFVQATYDLLTDENKRQHYIRLLPEAVKRFNFQTIGNKLEVLLDNL